MALRKRMNSWWRWRCMQGVREYPVELPGAKVPADEAA
jgi:hypothetical protein